MLKPYCLTLDASLVPLAQEYAEVCEEVAAFLIDTDRYKGADIYLQQALDYRQKIQGNYHCAPGEYQQGLLCVFIKLLEESC